MKKILELGCGNQKTKNAIGIDINPRSSADLIHDLNKFPYPFEDNTFDEIICNHVLEHLDNLIEVMKEIYRIAKPDAKVIIRVPHFSSVWSFQDITHKHSFGTRSFDYFIPDTDTHFFSLYSDPTVKFHKIEVELTFKGKSLIKKFLHYVINKYQNIYEEKFAFIFPRHEIYFKLEVIK